MVKFILFLSVGMYITSYTRLYTVLHHVSSSFHEHFVKNKLLKSRTLAQGRRAAIRRQVDKGEPTVPGCCAPEELRQERRGEVFRNHRTAYRRLTASLWSRGTWEEPSRCRGREKDDKTEQPPRGRLSLASGTVGCNGLLHLPSSTTYLPVFE